MGQIRTAKSNWAFWKRRYVFSAVWKFGYWKCIALHLLRGLEIQLGVLKLSSQGIPSFKKGAFCGVWATMAERGEQRQKQRQKQRLRS